MLINNSFLALAATIPASTAATKTTNALALVAGKDGDGAGPPATTVVVGWRGRLNPHVARGLAPSPHKKADLGALEVAQRRSQSSPPCPTLCPPNQVGYCAGSHISAINDGLVCDGECCNGDRACQGFTGCVKKDNSCEGQDACLDVFAPSGIENSCKGVSACDKMGFFGGLVGALKDSCIGKEACRDTGAALGEVGAIYESCNGYAACKSVGKGSEAVVGGLKGSCNGHESCNHLGAGGKVGAINKSCNGERSCNKVGQTNGKVGALDKSCNGLYACFASGQGDLGPITKSCNRDNSCRELAQLTHSIKSITKTCNNDKHKPCQVLIDPPYPAHVGHLTKFTHSEVGKKYSKSEIGGIVKCNDQCVNDSECMGIKWKDHSGMPCRFFGGKISENPCNGRNVCITV